MQVIYHNRTRLTPETEAACGARHVDKATLLREADHLVLVVPYSPSSHHAIGAPEIALMKPTATLTNIARGGIVDAAALHGVHKLIVMGVAGCGKSTLAAGLALALGCEMVEGDDHHLPASQDKMRRGIALDDNDREPWLDRLGALVVGCPGNAVAACSALKRRYRQRLRARVPGLQFVFVEIDQADAERRVASPSAHLFPAGLVASQFAALECPLGEPGVVSVAARLPPQAQLDTVLRWLATAPGALSDQTHYA